MCAGAQVCRCAGVCGARQQLRCSQAPAVVSATHVQDAGSQKTALQSVVFYFIWALELNSGCQARPSCWLTTFFKK